MAIAISDPPNYERFKIKHNGNFVNTIPRFINIGNGLVVTEDTLNDRLDIAVEEVEEVLVDRLLWLQNGVLVGTAALKPNFDSTDFTLTEDAVNQRLDIALSNILNNNEKVKAKADTTGNLIDVIHFNQGNDVHIGMNNNAEIMGVALDCGLGSSALWVNRVTNGILQCGGPNRYVALSETGLTAQRTFTFPDVSAKVLTDNQPTLPNNIAYWAKSPAGTANTLVYIGSDNNVYIGPVVTDANLLNLFFAIAATIPMSVDRSTGNLHCGGPNQTCSFF